MPGGSAQWGLLGGVCPGADPPVDRMTDRCKNITLPQLRCGRYKQSRNKIICPSPVLYFSVINLAKQGQLRVFPTEQSVIALLHGI